MAAVDRIANPWGARTPHAAGADWPVRVDEHTEREPERWVQSACVLCSNGCALDIGVAGGRIVAVRGREVDRVNHGRLGPKGLYGWQANSSPDRLTRPLVRRDGNLEETDWETAMGAVVERARQLLDEKGPSAFGFYITGQLFLEDYYTLAILARRHRHQPSRRQHPPLHRHGRRLAERELRLRWPAGVIRRRRPLRHPPPCRDQHRRDPDRDLVADARSAPRARPAAPRRDRPAPHARRARGRRPPRGPQRNQRRGAERAAARVDRERLGRAGVGRRTHRWVRGAREDGRGLHAGARRRDLRNRPEADPRGRGDPRHRRALALGRAAGCLPVEPGDAGSVPGQQPQPAPRDDREAGLRGPPDERAADCAEHPRDGLQRRPARFPQLAEPETRRRAGRAVERRSARDPALRAADACDADLPLRRAGVDLVPDEALQVGPSSQAARNRRAISSRSSRETSHIGWGRQGRERGLVHRPALVNGDPGLVFYDPAGRPVWVSAFEISDGVVVAIRSILNPDKLEHVPAH